MESVLLVITLVSLASTVVLAAILIRLVRDERRRSDARVAVLREMADRAWPTDDPGEQTLDNAADYEIERPIAALPRQDLFAGGRAPSPWPKRLALATGVALVFALGGWAIGSRVSLLRQSPAQAVRPAEAAASPLELVSLQQSQDTGAMTITGLVHNPRDGSVHSKVVATVLLFDGDGALVASGRAPLDFTVLRPGDESPFVISVPVAARVVKYRIGFRSEDGHVIGHIDRRTSSNMAAGDRSLPGSRGRA